MTSENQINERISEIQAEISEKLDRIDGKDLESQSINAIIRIASNHREIGVLYSKIGNIDEAKNSFALSSESYLNVVKNIRLRIDDLPLVRVRSEPRHLGRAIIMALISGDEDLNINTAKEAEDMTGLEVIDSDASGMEHVRFDYYSTKVQSALIRKTATRSLLNELEAAAQRADGDYKISIYRVYKAIFEEDAGKFESALENHIQKYEEKVQYSDPASLFCGTAITSLLIAQRHGLDTDVSDVIEDTELYIPTELL